MKPKMMQIMVVNFMTMFVAIMAMSIMNFTNPYSQIVINGAVLISVALVFGQTAIAAYKLQIIEEEKSKPKGKRSYGR